MGAIRRFNALEDENSVFQFTIDTNYIVSGATNGSENPLAYRIPIYYPTDSNNVFIIRVSDGRPDVAYIGSVANSSKLTLTFATAGVYQITLIGKSNSINFGAGYDKLKLISVDRVTPAFKINIANCFNGCVNMWFNATEPFKVTNTGGQNLFNGIKGFGASVDLHRMDISEVITVSGMFSNLQNALNTVPNPYINSSTSILSMYIGVQFSSSVNKIEVISNSVTNANNLLTNSNFQGELIINAPLTSIFQILSGVTNPPSLGKVDIRRVTINSNFITTVMSTANVDATLLGWASMDWTGFSSSLTWNFRNSKYSNNPSVIAAKSFLESKGLVFQNLTMA